MNDHSLKKMSVIIDIWNLCIYINKSAHFRHFQAYKELNEQQNTEHDCL